MFRTVLFSLLALFLFAGPVLAEDKSLVVASNPTWPPMEFLDEDKNIIGYDRDIMEAIAKETGLNLTFRNTAWDGIFATLESDQTQIIASCVTITEKRMGDGLDGGVFCTGAWHRGGIFRAGRAGPAHGGQGHAGDPAAEPALEQPSASGLRRARGGLGLAAGLARHPLGGRQRRGHVLRAARAAFHRRRLRRGPGAEARAGHRAAARRGLHNRGT